MGQYSAYIRKLWMAVTHKKWRARKFCFSSAITSCQEPAEFFFLIGELAIFWISAPAYQPSTWQSPSRRGVRNMTSQSWKFCTIPHTMGFYGTQIRAKMTAHFNLRRAQSSTLGRHISATYRDGWGSAIGHVVLKNDKIFKNVYTIPRNLTAECRPLLIQLKYLIFFLK